ncbi:MAG TPA: extracellular solute-binding protein [Thermomicrobiales bacterium]|nr:extracellular solute-binding protein [Thermomicrobiales bacterium]
MTASRIINRRLTRRQMIRATAATMAASGLAASQAYAAPMLNLRQSGPVELEFWGGEPEESGPGQLVAAFNESQSDIQVKYTRYVNDDTGNTQLDTALQGGTPIDVIQMYGNPRLAQRIGAGAVGNLSGYIEQEADIADWIGSEPEAVFGNDEGVFGIACVREPQVIFANQKLLDDAGVTIPDAWTTDDFKSLSKELSGNFAYGTFAPPDIARQMLGSDYWYKDGATESNFDDPAFRTAWETHRSMIDDGSSFPWSDVLARNLRVYQQNLYLTNQVAFWPTAFWVMRYINDTEEYPHDFLTTTLPLPVPADADPVYNPGVMGNWITMSPKSEKQDAAWEFIKYRLTDGSQFYLAAGKQPAFPGLDQDAIASGLLGESPEERYDVDSFKAVAFDESAVLTNDTVLVAGAEIQQIVQQNLDRYLIGEIELDDLVSEVKSKSDEAIAAAGA